MFFPISTYKIYCTINAQMLAFEAFYFLQVNNLSSVKNKVKESMYL